MITDKKKILDNCHPEQREGSGSARVSVSDDGFFTSFRMTGEGMFIPLSESICVIRG
jgi:hypothetical protein